MSRLPYKKLSEFQSHSFWLASTEIALFHQAAAATLGLGITDMKALSALWQEGPMTAGQLTRRLGLTTGAVTSVIDRLERQKFVMRQADRHDRRKVVVVANKRELQLSNKVYRPMGQAFTKLLQEYSTEELEFLARYYQDSIELTKQEIVRLTSRADN